MKSASTTVLLAMIALILISCDEDSGTNAPNGYRNTGDRIKRVRFDDERDLHNIQSDRYADFYYDETGKVDYIYLFINKVDKYDIIKITPKYNIDDTLYTFAKYDDTNLTPMEPFKSINISWINNIKTVDYKNLDAGESLSSDYSLIVKYNDESVDEILITEADEEIKYSFIYGDSVHIKITDIKGAKHIERDYYYTFELSNLPNPMILITDLDLKNDKDKYLFNSYPQNIGKVWYNRMFVNHNTMDVYTRRSSFQEYEAQYSDNGNLIQYNSVNYYDDVHGYNIKDNDLISIQWERVE